MYGNRWLLVIVLCYYGLLLVDVCDGYGLLVVVAWFDCCVLVVLDC